MKLPYCPAKSLTCRIVESRDRLYRVALAWCGDEMLADDLVQETLSTGIAKRSQLRDEKRLFAWLYSILNNQWNSYLRSKKSAIALDEQIPSDTRGPAEDCEQLDIVKRVRRAVASLPIIERQVITLVNLEEMSYAEVAMVLDIPIGTVMSRLHRARKHLLERMEHYPQVAATRNRNVYLVKK
jgi:RNA polymerase sigma-70 factor (ECF subfamily)